ncbi:MAG: bifunctional adenosylcobinamide kinase/adenosylcobinamide-phosphate guanylyltransferase [Acidimicrobiaceae bacterium]|nr:bifunctional adenosylcobinamide kinase/adenosylcobinamide-phosphate guanylyltransferase [Acidimicrobiaceae bacterium]MDE0605721.1 bifunctional adenosylcobinamide kinase/adenosylcobinamide-phosphate guanylyltransferase [Acidimicrobiaceae bacterium]
MLIFLTGGARSGKSSVAVRAAARRNTPVTVIATATAGDDEMAERIARHQQDRPDHWSLLEEPVDLLGAVAALGRDQTIIVDCLALWVANRLSDRPQKILDDAAALADLLAERSERAYVVSNEVGSGIVPGDALSRAFRDLLGSVNQRMARRADSAYLCVSGLLVALEQRADFDV